MKSPWADDGLALTLLGVGWVILALASHQWGLLLPLAVVTAAAPALRGRVPLPSGLIAHAGLAVPVVAHLQLRGVRGIADNPFNTGFHAAYYALAAGALALLAPDPQARLPRVVLFAACALTATSVGVPTYLADGAAWRSGPLGDLTPGPRALYLGGCLVFAVCALAAYRRSLPAARRTRRSRAAPAAAALCAGATIAAGFGAVRAAEVHYDAVNRAFVELVGGRFPRTGSAGFSGRAELGSVVARQEAGGRQVALRGFGASAPGYVRGAAFTTYRGGSWSRSRPGGEVDLPAGDALVLPGRPSVSRPAQLTIVPEERYGDSVFLPLAAAAVRGLSGEVVVDGAGAVALRAGSSADGYEVTLAAEPVHRGSDDPAARALPDDPELTAALDAALARFELAPGVAADEAVLRLARGFDARYRYRLGIRFARDRDPLAQFLGEKRHGHCELFASAGALLLRRLGFTTRYVTGFVCAEPSRLEDGVWIARDRHAHAWLELYRPQRGWRVVELTPGDGLPPATPAQGAEALSDWVSATWTRFLRFLRSLVEALGGAARQALAGLSRGWPWLALALALGGVALAWRGWRRRRRPPRFAASAPLTPALEAERRAFLALERRLAARGLGRGPGETLLEFARRLEDPAPDAAGRVRRFADRRYALGARLQPAQIGGRPIESGLPDPT